MSQQLHDGVPSLKALRDLGVRAAQVDGVTTFRLAGWSPIATFIAVLVIGVVVGSFLYPLLTMITRQSVVPMGFIIVAAIIVPGVGLALALRRRESIHSGREDFVVDDRRRTVTLPQTCGRINEDAIPFENIVAIDILIGDVKQRSGSRLTTVTGDGGVQITVRGGGDTYTVALTWRGSDGSHFVEPLVNWSDLVRTKAFARWLAYHIGVPARGPHAMVPEMTAKPTGDTGGDYDL